MEKRGAVVLGKMKYNLRRENETNENIGYKHIARYYKIYTNTYVLND